MRINIFLITLLLIIPLPVFSMTGEEAVQKINESLESFETMKGKLTVSYTSGETYSGIFMYSNPGKIYVKFMNPLEKFIVTNGKKLWAYDSSTDVCGVQDIEIEDEEDDEAGDKKTIGKKPEEEPKLTGGLERFFRNYEPAFIESGNPEENIIELVNEKWRYTLIKLVLNKDFMLVKAVFTDKNGEGFTVKLSDIKTGENIIPGLFNFNVPANAQIVKNPLDIR
ncbi:MAG: outer membrane lipoprotein carrier protein LolA [Spirochaetes bacterium]|nr:outer membrane lipoprotein carrier protein LolA [Spirochaetota bacterium]